MKIAITAGGTGGHIYPGLALAEEIKRQDKQAEIFFVGSEEGLEKEIVPQNGYQIRLIKARALLRKISYQAISAPFVCLAGFFQALSLFRQNAPDVFISTGGYVSLPAVSAARALSIPIYILEQNVLPGFTNRLLARLAKQVFLSFAESKQYLNGLVTGNPVRRAIIDADRMVARRRLGFGLEEKVIVIIGGSQGALRLNRTVLAALPLLDPKGTIKIVHVLGRRDYALAAGLDYPIYRPVAYLDNVAETLAAADLVISRAGATAIAEYAVRGLPMFLIPFPYSAEGHQQINAALVEQKGAGLRINESDFTPEKLISILFSDSNQLRKMGTAALRLSRPAAAKSIVEIIYGT